MIFSGQGRVSKPEHRPPDRDEDGQLRRSGHLRGNQTEPQKVSLLYPGRLSTLETLSYM